MEIPSLAEVDEELSHRRLATFIPRTSPRYHAPLHLGPLLDRFERAVRGEPQRVVCHAPPRHGKTEAALHLPAFALRRHPELVFSYSTYADRLSRSKSRKARTLAEAAGVRLASTSLNEWRTAEGGGMLAGGVGGPLTGHGVNIALIDDPTKNRVEAESQVYRDRLGDWYHDVLRTRIEPGGSIFVFATRWHPDDLSGRLIDDGFEYICLPALSDSGEALWSQRWTTEALMALRAEVGEYTWASLYQGQPRPRGGRVFEDVTLYDTPPGVYQMAGGLDLSYSAKTSGDYSVAVMMARDASGMHYILDVKRKQVRAPAFRGLWVHMAESYPDVPWRWYASGVEQGAGDFFVEGDDAPRLEVVSVQADKFVRSIDYAAAWNRGKVAVRRGAPWAKDVTLEHAAFTGVKDAHDDIVDACVAAFDLLQGDDYKPRTKPRTPTRRQGLAAMDL
jgi:predicted phage terminase large subunit-like protein